MTKPINEMTLEELAEYAVTLDGWEWMPGMVDSYGDIVVSSPSENWMYVCGRMYEDDTKREVAIGQEVQGTYPDLTDPATLGCVLAMARKKHGPMSRAICSDIYKWGFVSGRFAHHYILIDTELQTEAHALIAALAKEAS